MALARFAITLGVLACCTLSQASAQRIEDVDLNAERAGIEHFQDADQRLQNVGWRLVRGNAEFCTETTPSIGLKLQDLVSYGRPDIAKAALQLKGDFAVQAAAKGSPAASGKAFQRNREVVALGTQNPNHWSAGTHKHWERLTRAHDWIDERLRQNGTISITFADGAVQTVKPVQVCTTRFELLGGTKEAVADGESVFLGSRFPAFEWEEDDVFAGVIGHELAHNLLGHRNWLDRNKRKKRHIRMTEREADRLIPWLLANAGYDPQAAHTFMTRWGKNHDLGIFRSRAYEGWDERAEHIAAEIAIVRDLMKHEGKADWATHFRREIDPNLGLKTARTDH